MGEGGGSAGIPSPEIDTGSVLVVTWASSLYSLKFYKFPARLGIDLGDDEPVFLDGVLSRFYIEVLIFFEDC